KSGIKLKQARKSKEKHGQRMVKHKLRIYRDCGLQSFTTRDRIADHGCLTATTKAIA
ncbi:hypothetical protein HAX54_008831, partial [Datura stramonium]|nr:hypothetical protein [Datura stramonium]